MALIHIVMPAVGLYSTTQENGLGDTAYGSGDYSSKKYLYVKFSAGADTMALGDVVYYKTSETSEVTTDVSAATDLQMAGVIPSTDASGNTITVAPVDAQYGWIQIKGQSDALSNDIGGTTPAVGDLIGKISATDGAVDIIGGSADNERPAGWIIDVTASANKVILDCYSA